MNSTNMFLACPPAARVNNGDFAVALTLGVIHTALMVLAVVLTYAQLRRTPRADRK
jgi:hypothetical protein